MIRHDIRNFLATIPEGVRLVAATKYGDASDLRDLFAAGIHDFGENRTEAFLEKKSRLTDLPVRWHFIGHLQRNKCADVINEIDVLESLDSLSLAEKIEKERKEPLECYIEVSVNGEESKNGIAPEELESFLVSLKDFSKIQVTGLMMMAVRGSSEDSLHEQFSSLRKLKEKAEEDLGISLPHLSMGMSDDYRIALKEGATDIRLGRVLFEGLL